MCIAWMNTHSSVVCGIPLPPHPTIMLTALKGQQAGLAPWSVPRCNQRACPSTWTHFREGKSKSQLSDYWLQAKNSEGSWEPLGGVDVPQRSFRAGGTGGISKLILASLPPDSRLSQTPPAPSFSLSCPVPTSPPGWVPRSQGSTALPSSSRPAAGSQESPSLSGCSSGFGGSRLAASDISTCWPS